MDVSARSFCTAAVAAVAASAIAIAPAVIPKPSDETVPAAAPVTSQQMLDLLAAVAPDAPSPVSSAPLQTAVNPVPLNAAGDFIVNTWNAVLPWIDYGVNLVDYLGFIPFVSPVGDQINGVQVNIFYYNLIRPVANSFVVDLVAPVVDAPLNSASYINGLITLGSVAVNGLINTGIAEFNYIFGIILPPLPPLPLSVAADVAPPAAAVANIPATVKAALGTLPSVGKGTVAPPTDAPAGVADQVSGTNAVAPEAKPVRGPVSVHPDVGGVRVLEPLLAAPRDTANVPKDLGGSVPGTGTGSRASVTASATNGVRAAAGSVTSANTEVHKAGNNAKHGGS